MKALFQSVFARFNSADGAAFKAAISGKMYIDTAPDTAVLPYVVVSLPSNVPDQLKEVCEIQFSIFSASSSATEVCDIYTALTELFDNCDLDNLGNPDNLGMERSFSHLIYDSDAKVRQYVVQYECWVLRR